MFSNAAAKQESLMPIKSVFDIDVKTIGKDNCRQIAQFLDINAPHFNASERKKALVLAKKIRNLGFLPYVETGLISILPANKKIHFWNAALQSPLFKMCLYKTKEKDDYDQKKEITLQHYDQNGIKWIIDYLEFSDKERRKIINNQPADLIEPLLMLGNQFNLKRLTEDQEIKVVQAAPLPATFFTNFAHLESNAFPMLHTFLFLTKFLGAKNKIKPESTLIQNKARSFLLSRLNHKQNIKLCQEDLPILKDVLLTKALKLDFTIDENWVVTDAEWEMLFNASCKCLAANLKIELLDIKLKEIGNQTLRPTPIKYFVDGFSKENYFKNAIYTLEQKTSKRYKEQKHFFEAPYPAKNVDTVAFLKNNPNQAFSLIDRFPEIGLGISISEEAFSLVQVPIQPLDNVYLLAFEGGLPEEDNLVEKCIALITAFPRLKTIVVGAHWLEVFADEAFEKIAKNKISIWKNLTGTVVRGRVSIKDAFSFEWVKNESSYLKEFSYFQTEDLTDEQKRVYGLLEKIPFLDRGSGT